MSFGKIIFQIGGDTMDIISHKKEFYEEYNKRVDKALTILGLVAERYASDICPKDTGRLANSITHKVSGNEAIIGTNVEYASYVELGTSRQTAQPYLRPAATDHVDEYTDIVKRVLKGEF
jgi:HK97 gp10 family phage protein